jgi:subtilisin family serine protease
MVKGRRLRHVLGAMALAMSVWVLAIAPVAAYTGPGGSSGGSSGGTSSGSSSSTSTLTSSAGLDPMAPGEIILKLNSAADLRSVAAQYQLDPTPLDQLTIAPLFLMRVVDGTPPDVKATVVASDTRVAYAEANLVGSTAEDQVASPWSSGDGPGPYLGQWASTMIRLPQAFRVTRGGGVIVAVLDTGVDANHPALADHLIDGYNFVDNNTDTSEVGQPLINHGYGHGTFVAGLVALAAPEAAIMPVRVLDPDGVGDVWRLSKAMVWAASNGATVINLSLATHTRTHVTNDLITALALNGRGVVVAAAAGNFATSQPQFPAAEGGARVLSVSASSPLDTLAPFSDFGSWVRVAAPGISVYSTIPGGQYASWNGTSMSTGLASGAAALVRAANPSLSAQDVIARLANTSAKISGAVPLRLNVGAALGQ